jgi:hypothetical protein
MKFTVHDPYRVYSACSINTQSDLHENYDAAMHFKGLIMVMHNAKLTDAPIQYLHHHRGEL